jgi:dihydrolipoamide dehydrogenase
MKEHFDVVILGGGSGGYVAAIRAGQLGLRAALVEKDKIGGTCLNRGCIPTKSFLETANLLSRIRRAQDFGITVDNATLDYPRLLKRTDQIVSQLTRGVEFLLQKNGVTLVRGEGTIASPTSLTVRLANGQEQTIEVANMVLATGSSPKEVPGLPFDGRQVISSDHALLLQDVPKSIIIVGAGAVGVEFASIYNDFGAEVTMVEMLPSLVPLEDREIAIELARVYNRRGITTLTGAKAGNMQVSAGGVSLEVTQGDGMQTLKADVLLVAVGRSANTRGFGLERLDLAMDRGFIKVDKLQSSSQPGVYAIGDVAGGYMLAHKAMAEGIVAIDTIAGRETEPVDPDRVPRATYSRPEVASVGLSEEAALQRGVTIKVGRFPFRANARAVINGETDGFAKLVSDESSGEVLGMHLIGPHVTELIAEPALAKLLESTPWELGTSIHAHPTLSEVIGEAALDVEDRAIHTFKPPQAKTAKG